MIWIVVAAFLVGFTLIGFVAGYVLGCTHQSDFSRWEINLWKKRCADLERDLHVRRVR